MNFEFEKTCGKEGEPFGFGFSFRFTTNDIELDVPSTFISFFYDEKNVLKSIFEERSELIKDDGTVVDNNHRVDVPDLNFADKKTYTYKFGKYIFDFGYGRVYVEHDDGTSLDFIVTQDFLDQFTDFLKCVSETMNDTLSENAFNAISDLECKDIDDDYFKTLKVKYFKEFYESSRCNDSFKNYYENGVYVDRTLPVKKSKAIS